MSSNLTASALKLKRKTHESAFFFLVSEASPDPSAGACEIRKPFPCECTHERKRCTEPVRFEKRTRGLTSIFSHLAFPLKNDRLSPMNIEKNYKHLGTISVLFVSVLLISNVASAKIVDLGWFTFDGGTLLFPISYIFGDILTEVYGYKKTRGVIWLGFLSALIMSIVFIVVGKLPPASDWNNQAAYDAILGLTPRIVIASLIAYMCGSFSNSLILAKMKVWTNGKHLWARTIGSTLVGELVDSSLFILIAFLGILPGSLIITLIISNYIFKTLVEVVLTPVTYKVVHFLKKNEGEDYYDKDTNFNPFA